MFTFSAGGWAVLYITAKSVPVLSNQAGSLARIFAVIPNSAFYVLITKHSARSYTLLLSSMMSTVSQSLTAFSIPLTSKLGSYALNILRNVHLDNADRCRRWTGGSLTKCGSAFLRLFPPSRKPSIGFAVPNIIHKNLMKGKLFLICTLSSAAKRIKAKRSRA